MVVLCIARRLMLWQFITNFLLDSQELNKTYDNMRAKRLAPSVATQSLNKCVQYAIRLARGSQTVRLGEGIRNKMLAEEDRSHSRAQVPFSPSGSL